MNIDTKHTNSNNTVKICPHCKKQYRSYPAISRRDNKTKICTRCGIREAVQDFMNFLHRQPD